MTAMVSGSELTDIVGSQDFNLPLWAATGGMAALAIFSFMGHWNAFMGPLIYLNKPELYTLPLFLAVLDSGVSGRTVPLHLIFTASFVSILPILLIFLFAQRYFIAGPTAGSIK
ncbi:MAG: hypothetical protein OXC27_21205 [Caldilineaceae bacterium]|nr:hypothetical protein [Caldilineaceae bacterium]